MIMVFSILIMVLPVISSAFPTNECPKIVTQKGFDINKYLGVWYEAYRNNNNFEFGFICANATYTKNADGSIRIFDQALNIFGTGASLLGTARVKNASEPAALEATFPPPILKTNYNVITTDYDQYSLVYSCNKPFAFSIKTEFIFMLSRTKILPLETFYKLKQILVNMGAEVSFLQQTPQNC
jgi:apolipoprotein D and lipocalin family protein